MELEGISRLIGVCSPWVVTDVKIQTQNLVVDVFIEYERGSRFACPHCGTESKVHDGAFKRIRHLDIFEYRCYLNIKVPRVKCEKDGVSVAHADFWGRQGSHYSQKFEAMVMRFCREMTMLAVSREFGEPDNNLWRIFKYHVKRTIIDDLDLKKVKRVCVDETAVARGQKYISIFTDYDTGRVIFVADGRKMEVFSLFYDWLKAKNGKPENIELFSMDMSVSYQAGRNHYFSHSQVVFDRFHIKSYLNDAIGEVRREEVKTDESLKKTKYMWLKNEQNLTSSQKQQLFVFLHETSLDTVKAYKLKRGFDQLWEVQSKAVEPLLEKWMELATILDLEPINRFVNTVKSHFDGIAQSIKSGITNAVSEGINSVIQLARTRARGFRNIDNFMYMVYFLGLG